MTGHHGDGAGDGGRSANGGLEANLDEEERRRMEVEHYVERARAELDRYADRAASLIRERPVAAIAGAAALGFLIGRIASRR